MAAACVDSFFDVNVFSFSFSFRFSPSLYSAMIAHKKNRSWSSFSGPAFPLGHLGEV